MDLARHILESVQQQLTKQRHLAEAALEQVSDEQFFETLSTDSSSLALLVKHLAGNMRSRFTDFLTTDGDKEDRHRDREFEIEPGDSRESLEGAWRHAWETADEAIYTLSLQNLLSTITIRGEPHTVLQALVRHLGHLAYHVGQIVQLARHLKGDQWRTLSIPRGGSEAYRQEMLRRHGSR